jgi:hypothetical protein
LSGTRPRPPRRPEPESASAQDAHRLAALAGDCESTGIARRCLVLRLSLLPADLRKPQHLRLARDALDPLLSADRAQRFILPNDDIVMVWRGTADAPLAASRHAVTQMFADTDAEMTEVLGLWLMLDLPGDVAALREVLAASLSNVPTPVEKPRAAPLDAAALAALEAALSQADVARFARRRVVCLPAADGKFRSVWEIRYLAAEELCAELAEGRAARAEPWLYRRLARTLDRRLLVLLAASQELRAAGPFGLELNVASILGPDFLRFDTALPQLLRGRVTIGMQPADILADLPAFLFARDFARARGYRLMLSLPDCDMLPILPLAKLGLDLVEIGWTPSVQALPIELIEREAGHMVLARADSPEAVAWGQAHGIGLFEGRAAAPGMPTFAPPPLAPARSL